MKDLDTREVLFLGASNALAGAPEIDYARALYQAAGQGHAGALMASQSRARARSPLTIRDLEQWHRWMADEWRQAGMAIPTDSVGALRSEKIAYAVRWGGHLAPQPQRIPPLVQQWLGGWNALLADLARSTPPELVLLVDGVGPCLQRWFQLQPFRDGSVAVGLLLLAYAAAFLRYPLPVVRASERHALVQAVGDPMSARLWLAEKMREAILTPAGVVVERSTSYGPVDVYVGPSGEQRVERLELLAVQEVWRAAIPR